MRRPPSHSRTLRGFTLFEALLAVAFTAMAGAALLSSLSGAVQASTDSLLGFVARGLAEQLMDEIASSRYPQSTNTTPSGSGRTGFDDIDDYSGWTAKPPVDRQGRTLGTWGLNASTQFTDRHATLRPDATFLNRFRHTVVVERVQQDTGTAWTVVSTHTNHRRVTVRIQYTDDLGQTRTMFELTRIFGYVPVAP